MKTFYFSQDQLERPAELLKQNRLVVFPTETVYGVGAHACNDDACLEIFKAKGRPSDNPLIVHISDLRFLERVASSPPALAILLLEKFSPGPFTVIVPKNSTISSVVTAGLNKVAVRIPSHPVARHLLEMADVPVAAPSANRSGRPSATTFLMAKQEMNGRVSAIVDGGDCKIGLESTVVDVEENFVAILREGAVSSQEILSVLPSSIRLLNGTTTIHQPQSHPNTISSFVRDNPEFEISASPGVKYSHYRPSCEILLVLPNQWREAWALFGAKKVGVLALSELPCLGELWQALVFASPEDYAHSLYRSFVFFEREGFSLILAEYPEISCGIGEALRNRLGKAGDFFVFKAPT